MTTSRKAQEILDREFLEIRAKLLQLAAHFDRIDRGDGDVDLQRMSLLREAVELLSSTQVGPHRAEKLQRIFSREFEPGWRSTLKVDEGRVVR